MEAHEIGVKAGEASREGDVSRQQSWRDYFRRCYPGARLSAPETLAYDAGFREGRGTGPVAVSGRGGW